jgi:hypothetical protein
MKMITRSTVARRWFSSGLQNCMPKYLKVRREVHDGWESTGRGIQFGKNP